MKKIQSILFSVVLAALVWNHTASAADFLPRPIFMNRSFSLVMNQPVTDLSSALIPTKLWIFDQAIKTCRISPEEVQGKLSFILSQENALWDTLNFIFPESFEQVKLKNITVVVDDFSSFAGKHPEFSSYFYQSDFTGSMIGIDCSSPVAQNYWLPSLVHEFTHALFHDVKVESWWEEGIAQYLEEAIGGTQPMLTRGYFEKAKSIPYLLETSRPLPSRESYAMSSLFVQYLKYAFGGSSVLKVMSAQTLGEWFVSAIQSAKSSLLQPSESFLQRNAILTSDKLTRAGLLRYFYVALTMNNSKVAKYKIPGWNGFEKLPDQALEGVLKPGGAATISSTKLLDHFPEFNLKSEVYRVILSESGDFEILSGESIRHPQKKLIPKLDYGLIINTSDDVQNILSH